MHRIEVMFFSTQNNTASNDSKYKAKQLEPNVQMFFASAAQVHRPAVELRQQ